MSVVNLKAVNTDGRKNMSQTFQYTRIVKVKLNGSRRLRLPDFKTIGT